MFNEELLIEVLGWQSESSKEKEQIVPTLTDYLNALSLRHEILIEEDTHGNIYVTKGKSDLYPCIVSHLDQVHKYNQNKKIIKNGDYLLAFDGARQIGTGGDDLVGVFICLNLLEFTNNIKVAFFLQEEIGCIGSNACDLDFFKNCKFIGQADRKGNADFINYSNGVKLFDEEFSTFVAPILNSFNYKECSGIATDVGALSKRNVDIACFNISCGYHNPHTSTEYCVISEVEACYNLIKDIIEQAKIQFVYVRPKPVLANTSYVQPNKSRLYVLLFEAFKKHPKYIKSNKMSYAYSLALDFINDIVVEYDKFIDEFAADYPYISDQLEEFLEYKTESEKEVKEVKQLNPSSFHQTKLFNDGTCEHRNVRRDSSMGPDVYYCMDCFDYIDSAEAYYDQDTLNPFEVQKGYY